MFSFFRLEIGHSLNRKTLVFPCSSDFPLLCFALSFASSGICFIPLHFFSFSFQRSPYSLHMAPFHFAAALPSRSSSRNTLPLPILI